MFHHGLCANTSEFLPAVGGGSAVSYIYIYIHTIWWRGPRFCLLAEGAHEGKGASNAVAVVVGRLAAIQGDAVFRVTLSALTTTGTNWINPATVVHRTNTLSWDGF